jgi:hypothetical protein
MGGVLGNMVAGSGRDFRENEEEEDANKIDRAVCL